MTGAHLFSTTIEDASKIENSSDVNREKGVVFSDAVKMQNIFFFSKKIRSAKIVNFTLKVKRSVLWTKNRGKASTLNEAKKYY